jgi:hypothetical protein
LIVVAIAINARDRASIARREPESVVTTENALANRRTRFGQKTGFGERR